MIPVRPIRLPEHVGVVDCWPLAFLSADPADVFYMIDSDRAIVEGGHGPILIAHRDGIVRELSRDEWAWWTSPHRTTPLGKLGA